MHRDWRLTLDIVRMAANEQVEESESDCQPECTNLSHLVKKMICGERPGVEFLTDWRRCRMCVVTVSARWHTDVYRRSSRRGDEVLSALRGPEPNRKTREKIPRADETE
jgi:hypothetical protein